MQLKVVTYNVGCKKLDEVLDFFTGSDLASADLALLQEVELSENTELLKAVAFRHKGFNVLYHPVRQLRSGTHGLAILSKYEIEELGVVRLPEYNLVFNSRERFIQKASLKLGENKIEVNNLHLDNRLNWRDRIAQLSPVFKNVHEDRVLVAGDFNTSPLYFFGRVVPIWIRDQLGFITSRMQHEGFKWFDYPGFSFNLGLWGWRLDHIFVKNLHLSQVQVLEQFSFSDHYPVHGLVDIFNS